MTDPASIPTTTLLAMLRRLRETCRYGFDDYERSVIAEIGRRVILAEQLVQADADKTASNNYGYGPSWADYVKDPVSIMKGKTDEPQRITADMLRDPRIAFSDEMEAGLRAKGVDIRREIGTRPDTAGMP